MKRLRPVLLLLVVVLAFTHGVSLYQPTGTGEAGPTVAFSAAQLVKDLGLPTLVLLVVAVLASLAATDAGALRAGAAFLVGSEPSASLLPAHRSLAAAARAMVAGGLVFGLLAAAAAFFLLTGKGDGQQAAPQDVARLIQSCLAMPIAALAVGRIVFGGAADAAAAKAGAGERRAFRRQDDLLLLVYLVPPVLVLAVLTWPASVLH